MLRLRQEIICFQKRSARISSFIHLSIQRVRWHCEGCKLTPDMAQQAEITLLAFQFQKDMLLVMAQSISWNAVVWNRSSFYKRPNIMDTSISWAGIAA